jgi:hypothetical protein
VLFLNANINYDISKIVSTCYCNLRKKTPETLDFTGLPGGVFGVPKGIRTPDLSLRRRTLYPTELLAHNITIVYDGLRFVKKLGNFLILLNIQKN